MFRIIILLLFALIPPAIYFSLDRIQPRYVCLVLISLFALRMLPSWKQISRFNALKLWSVLMLSALLAIAISDNVTALLLYPVVMNIGFLILFVYSLIIPPSIVEKIARLQDANLPESGVEYTRKVTMVWCVFLLFNACIAAWTVWNGDRDLWGLYNGLIAYLLMGTLMIAEYYVRCKVRNS